MKIEIRNLRSQRNLLARGSANTADMRQEVLQLNRVLVQERVRSRALENEMTTPMNIHRQENVKTFFRIQAHFYFVFIDGESLAELIQTKQSS